MLGLRSRVGSSPVLARGDCSLVAVCRLTAVASLVAGHGTQTSVVVALGL